MLILYLAEIVIVMLHYEFSQRLFRGPSVAEGSRRNEDRNEFRKKNEAEVEKEEEGSELGA